MNYDQSQYAQGAQPQGIHVSQAELMQLRGEIERTKGWVKRQQFKKFMNTFVAWVVAYVVMIVINLILFAILAAFIPALRQGPWYAYLLLLIPPICALPPFLPLVVGIMVGVPLRRRNKEQGPFFMG